MRIFAAMVAGVLLMTYGATCVYAAEELMQEVPYENSATSRAEEVEEIIEIDYDYPEYIEGRGQGGYGTEQMTRIFNLCDILKFIIYSFYKRPFPQANRVGNAHKRVFHIILDFGKQLDTINKKALKKSFSNIPLITEKLSFYVFQENSLFQWLSVINTTCCKNKIQDFSFVVDYKV